MTDYEVSHYFWVLRTIEQIHGSVARLPVQ